jgi:hypothetical protein
MSSLNRSAPPQRKQTPTALIWAERPIAEQSEPFRTGSAQAFTPGQPIAPTGLLLALTRTCKGAGQAQNETSIAINPNDNSQLLASFNDYRRGDGNCFASFSGDGGCSWGDTTPPMSFTRGTPYGAARQYWQAGGDTSVAWNTKGNAYLSCQMFMRGQPTSTNPGLSSAFFVCRSTGNAGASWNFSATPVIESPDPAR